MSFLKVQNQTKPIFSESQIFVQKFNFDKTITFSRFFSSKFFLTIFLVKSKLSTAKKSKTTTFSRVFHPPKKSTIFSGNQSWIFGQKMKISNSVFNCSSIAPACFLCPPPIKEKDYSPKWPQLKFEKKVARESCMSVRIRKSRRQ